MNKGIAGGNRQKDKDLLLVLKGVYKSYDHDGKSIEVLKGLDMEVTEGESVAVVGVSGVGKTTLLNIMGSLDPPNKGRVEFMGQDLYAMKEEELCRFRNENIGFVFQFHHLLPELSALENVMMPALINRLDKTRARNMARDMLDKVGLSHRVTHQSGELSGGEQQRVAIARALVMRPRLLLADEPTGNLDWITGEAIAELLVKLNVEEKVALVVATHNMKLASKMSRQVEIVGGKLV